LISQGTKFQFIKNMFITIYGTILGQLESDQKGFFFN